MACWAACVGGENVYCSEVEAVLSAHPQVLQAAAFGMPNAVMGEMVHSAIVLRQPSITPVTPQVIITWCQSQLAIYKCPTSVHIVDELPTTGSGRCSRMCSELRSVRVVRQQQLLQQLLGLQ